MSNNQKGLFMKRKMLFSIIMCFALGLLSGCATQNRATQPLTKKRLAYGECCSYQKQNKIVSELERYNAQVSFLGDHIYLVMPTYPFFNNHSVHLIPDAHKVLDTIVQFIKCYQKIGVRVVAYNEELPNQQASQSLSTLQAYKIANYLWRKGIDSRFIYAVGKGKAQAGHVVGKHRIEIYLQKLP